MSHENIASNQEGIENPQFLEDLVDQAFEQRTKKSNDVDTSSEESSYLEYLDNKKRGVFDSEDPRFQRVLIDGNRIVVEDLEDYILLLKLSFGKLYSDQEETDLIASKAFDSMMDQANHNPITEERRYVIDFMETADGFPSLSTDSMTIRKFLSQSPEYREFDLKPERPIEFVSQNDPKFQCVVEAGIVRNLKEANLCWLAGTEMGLSAFIPDSDKRETVMRKLVARIKDPENFDKTGAIIGNKLNQLVEALNGSLLSEEVPVKANYYEETVFNDIAGRQRDGSVLLFGMSDRPGSTHLMVMSEILKEEGDRVFFQVFNPGGRDITEGSRITDNYTIYQDFINEKFMLSPQMITLNTIRDE